MLTPGRSILALPSKETPPIVLAVSRAVAVAELPVELPADPVTLPVRLPVTLPVTLPIKLPDIVKPLLLADIVCCAAPVPITIVLPERYKSLNLLVLLPKSNFSFSLGII